MSETLIVIGAFCVIAAIVGGGLSLANVGQMPEIASVRRQAMLALFGLAAIGGGVLAGGDDPSPAGDDSTGGRPPATSPPSPPEPDDAGDELALELSRHSGRPGTSVKVEGYGFTAGEDVVVSLDTMRLTSERADRRGRFRVTVKIPPTHFVKQYSLNARSRNGVNHAEETFTVTACATGWTKFSGACFRR